MGRDSCVGSCPPQRDDQVQGRYKNGCRWERLKVDSNRVDLANSIPVTVPVEVVVTGNIVVVVAMALESAGMVVVVARVVPSIRRASMVIAVAATVVATVMAAVAIVRRPWGTVRSIVGAMTRQATLYVAAIGAWPASESVAGKKEQAAQDNCRSE